MILSLFFYCTGNYPCFLYSNEITPIFDTRYEITLIFGTVIQITHIFGSGYAITLTFGTVHDGLRKTLYLILTPQDSCAVTTGTLKKPNNRAQHSLPTTTIFKY